MFFTVIKSGTFRNCSLNGSLTALLPKPLFVRVQAAISRLYLYINCFMQHVYRGGVLDDGWEDTLPEPAEAEEESQRAYGEPGEGPQEHDGQNRPSGAQQRPL